MGRHSWLGTCCHSVIPFSFALCTQALSAPPPGAPSLCKRHSITSHDISRTRITFGTPENSLAASPAVMQQLALQYYEYYAYV